MFVDSFPMLRRGWDQLLDTFLSQWTEDSVDWSTSPRRYPISVEVWTK